MAIPVTKVVMGEGSNMHETTASCRDNRRADGENCKNDSKSMIESPEFCHAILVIFV